MYYRCTQAAHRTGKLIVTAKCQRVYVYAEKIDRKFLFSFVKMIFSKMIVLVESCAAFGSSFVERFDYILV